MTNIDLNNKTFRSAKNANNGEVSDQTVFHYHQEGSMIWAEYYGGQILKGFLIGKVLDNRIDFTYQHLNQELELMTGTCVSYPIVTVFDKIQLNEFWQWTCRDFSKGESIIIEV